MNNKKTYFGDTHFLIIQQEIGLSKILSELREKYIVRELEDKNDGEVILIEEKPTLCPS